MKSKSLAIVAKSVWTTIKKHSPEILTGLGIVGMVTSTVLAVKSTPSAMLKIVEKKDELDKDDLTIVETIKAAWKCYIPSAVTGAVSTACLIGASSVNLNRNAALATAYAISETALKEYQEKVLETIGEKKEQVVRDVLAKEKVERHPIEESEVIITDKGNTLCYDALSGRYFKSDIDKLKKAQNELNRQMIGDMYASLNDFYYEIGLSSTKIGGDVGWNVDEALIDLVFSSTLATDGTPCLVIDYRVPPKYGYQR
ncbi:MAG: DUF6353 family protein [Clostridia bacterium]